jgi:hypothetical protein
VARNWRRKHEGERGEEAVKIWAERVDAVLADPKKATIAAALYYLVDESVNMPVTRKRKTPEESLMEEAVCIEGYVNQVRASQNQDRRKP